MDSRHYLAFRVRTECSSCGAPIPLNSPVETASCPICQQEHHLPPELWGALFQEVYERIGIPSQEGGHSPITLQGPPSLTVQFQEGEPHCNSCQHPLALPDNGDQLDSVQCDSCGTNLLVTNAPAWVPGYQRIRFIGLEIPERNNRSTPSAASPFVTTHCPSCSGSLYLTQESARQTTCDHCAEEFQIPDPLWNRLHPGQGAVTWIACINGEATETDNSDKQENSTSEGQRYCQTYADYKAQLTLLQTMLTALKKKRKNLIVSGFIVAMASGSAIFGFFTSTYSPIVKVVGKLFCDGESTPVSNASEGRRATVHDVNVVCREGETTRYIGGRLFLLGAIAGFLFCSAFWIVWLHFSSRRYKEKCNMFLNEIASLHPPKSPPAKDPSQTE